MYYSSLVYLLKLRYRKGDSQIKKRLPVSSSVVGAWLRMKGTKTSQTLGFWMGVGTNDSGLSCFSSPPALQSEKQHVHAPPLPHNGMRHFLCSSVAITGPVIYSSETSSPPLDVLSASVDTNWSLGGGYCCYSRQWHSFLLIWLHNSWIPVLQGVRKFVTQLWLDISLSCMTQWQNPLNHISSKVGEFFWSMPCHCSGIITLVLIGNSFWADSWFSCKRV